ncbi:MULTISPECIES: hypothetical protein [unclassified Cryobacterium]|uniref:DUF6414 family protein n=2 Tax=Cryobacterium TaxID=69578 RepID=UPI002AB59012|nr:MULTISPECIES: hypothetical protein [unclassified Cryobacterium]MDY7529254.1 hypothetical protein [Cryobacterium sp. 10C2]MEB0289733.1 hypothetical protein [Cryobacterium sp. 10C2]MEB0304127.1 hypothetical protein [Cryobacterium sp. 10I1]
MQQLLDSPLVTSTIEETHSDSSKTKSGDADATLTADATAKFPLVGKATVAGDITLAGSLAKAVSTGSRSTQSFVYSQAFYLNVVRRALKEKGLLRTLSSVADAESIEGGEFVEYQATFRPSELVTIMDVVTPELVSQIAKFIVKKKELALFNDYGDLEKVRIAALKMEHTGTAQGDLWGDVTRAVQADFRRDKTREYYGLVGSDDDTFTAVTICDNPHFVVDDEDRILDGVFTVLGKAISPAEENVPVLQRNKLLRNVNPDGVDALIAGMKATLSSQSPAKFGGTTVDALLNPELTSRIAGKSIRIIPLAIYA